MSEKVTLITRRKTIQLVLDYCLENKIPFHVSPREMMNDEFEMDLTISNIKPAVAFGMFAKEHKFEVFGMGEFLKPKVASTPVKKIEAKENGTVAEISQVKKEQAAVLNF
jgi:hypothetical protein